MRKVNLTFRLESSLVHIEETNSNIANIYRERILRDGQIHNVPAVHGNSIRGVWRDIGANQLCELLEIEPGTLPTNVFHILFSGGYLDKSISYLDPGRKRKMREMLPFLSVFGSAIGNEMLQGKLRVGTAYPRCRELGTGELSYNDMCTLVRYTRQDDTKRFIGENHAEDKTQQMFYDIEVLVKGVELDCEVVIDSDDEIELSMFDHIIDAFKLKPHLGGASRIGHGKVTFDYDGDGSAYVDYVTRNKEAIREYLLSEFTGKA